MEALTAVRFRNLRSLRDTQRVALAKINVLVGRNSAGKSTFARVFPLLRQSMEARKREPLLWWGRLVDFGSFSDSVNRECNPQKISFAFEFKLNLLLLKDQFVRRSSRTDEEAEKSVVIVAMSLIRANDREETLIEELTIDVGNACNLRYLFDERNELKTLEVNGDAFVWNKASKDRARTQFNSVLPEVYILREVSSAVTGEERKIFVRHDVFGDLLRKMLVSLVHGNTSRETLDNISEQIVPWTGEEMIRSCKAVKDAPASWYLSAKTSLTHPESNNLSRLRAATIAAYSSNVLSAIDTELSSYFQRVAYVEPLRATAERYYRRQGLAVDDVDPKGANVAFFLDSLNVTERRDFDVWMTRYFQAKIVTKTEAGQLSIKLLEAAGAETNLADVGFGYSQLLPIALQLWIAARGARTVSARRRRASIVVIEQPELHLHPAYQTRIADLIAAASLDNPSLTIILETHSPSIINRFGALIGEGGGITAADVQVLRFEKTDAGSDTTLFPSEYTSDGVLKDWPFGFFDA